MLWSAAYNSLFLFIAARSRSAEAVQAFFPLFAPLTFLSSVWIPRQLMPGWAEQVAGLNPVSGIARALRDALSSGVDVGSLSVAVAVAATGTVFFQAMTARTLTAQMRGA